jgi:AraC family transcriptional regulator
MQEINYYEKARKAIDFIEANLKQDISVEKIASETAYSRFHFTRKFLELTGRTPGAYLRKRRLEDAAKEILSGRDILGIALDYRFGSHQAFTRSFKAYFGTTPKLYRDYKLLPMEEGKTTMKKELENLKWKNHWITHLGCLGGCLDYLKRGVSDAWLFGATGHAFLLNMGEGV